MGGVSRHELQFERWPTRRAVYWPIPDIAVTRFGATIVSSAVSTGAMAGASPARIRGMAAMVTGTAQARRPARLRHLTSLPARQGMQLQEPYTGPVLLPELSRVTELAIVLPVPRAVEPPPRRQGLELPLLLQALPTAVRVGKC